MRSVLSYPGNMEHAQQIALALHEHGWLEAFVTTFHHRPDGILDRTLRTLPSSLTARLRMQLERRSIGRVPHDIVCGYPFWEVLRSAALKGGAGPVVVDRLWDEMSHRFDELVARRHVMGMQAVHAFEYTALATFQRARAEHVVPILHLPSLSSRQSEEIRKREIVRFREEDDPNAAYFARKFPGRQARRDAEIALADLIVANSSLTARSHIAHGADPAKVIVVPLGAPPVLAEARPTSTQGPLNVLYAGHFSIGKGAHYLLDAWRRLRPEGMARLDVYGEVYLSERLLSPAAQAVTFHGAVARSELFQAYRRADILVFPSLSDGFGMVVVEAMANGLPVITTDMVGASDLVNGKNGFVIPSADPEALAQALRWCLDNRTALQAMRIEALDTARRHQWSDYRGRLIEQVGTGLASPDCPAHLAGTAASRTSGR